MVIGVCEWCNEEIHGHEAYATRCDEIDDEDTVIHFHCMAEEADCENF